MFRGSMVALVTPFENDEVDVTRLRELVEFHITEGTHAIIAAGTTGEAGTLSHSEKQLVIKIIVEQARERIPVIAGTAANATRECIELTKMAMECGAHAALIMTPAYIKPTQEGLYQHYSHIAAAVPIPLILYNVPGRTACDMLPETVNRLAKISNIIGIKEATGKINRLHEILENCQGSIDVYSGDDETAAQWLNEGAKGVISVTANIVPRLMAKLCDTAMDHNKTECLQINRQLEQLHKLLFVESNPIPAKWALSEMGLIKNELRLPLTPLSEAYYPALREVLYELQLVK